MNTSNFVRDKEGILKECLVILQETPTKSQPKLGVIQPNMGLFDWFLTARPLTITTLPNCYIGRSYSKPNPANNVTM